MKRTLGYLALAVAALLFLLANVGVCGAGPLYRLLDGGALVLEEWLLLGATGAAFAAGVVLLARGAAEPRRPRGARSPGGDGRTPSGER